MRRIVVAGGSIAAVTAADALRQHGHEGEIVMLSDEKYAPYRRPPLSKGMLTGAEARESVSMAAVDNGVELVLGARITGLDTDAKRLSLADGTSVDYDGLVIATGARARRLLGEDSPETVLRDMDDALSIQARFATAKSVLIIGGGFLGMEIASTARTFGLDVTVIDMLPHLVRQFGSFLAEAMTAAAVAQGVKLVCAPEGIDLVDEDPLTTVRTADGAAYSADLIITAAGDIPNTEWLGSARLGGPGGLAVDSRCRVAPDIVAAGDIVALPEDLAPPNGPRRTPHWSAAIDQARTAAAALLMRDAAPPYKPAPYFWTEQWGMDIKIFGRIVPGALAETLEGSLADGSALIRYSRDGVPLAAATVNHRMPLVKLRRLASLLPH